MTNRAAGGGKVDDYAGRVLADRYRLPLPPSDEYEFTETRAFDTYSGQEVLVRQVPLPEVVEAEVLDAEGLPEGFTARERTSRRAPEGRTATRQPADPAVRRAVEAAQAAARIPDHPRLDQVFDVFAEGGSLWIVSELVAARPLAALLTGKPLSPYRAAEVASDVLMALRVLHAHGWVHRNITVRTILVCDDGRVMLTGLAVGAAEEALCGYDPVPAPDGHAEDTGEVSGGQPRAAGAAERGGPSGPGPGPGTGVPTGPGGRAGGMPGGAGGPTADVDPEAARGAPPSGHGRPEDCRLRTRTGGPDRRSSRPWRAGPTSAPPGRAPSPRTARVPVPPPGCTRPSRAGAPRCPAPVRPPRTTPAPAGVTARAGRRTPRRRAPCRRPAGSPTRTECEAPPGTAPHRAPEPVARCPPRSAVRPGRACPDRCRPRGTARPRRTRGAGRSGRAAPPPAPNSPPAHSPHSRAAGGTSRVPCAVAPVPRSPPSGPGRCG
ncbi:hypothetical protein GCM10017687_71370 [Streptomyces echinatus]